MPDFVVALHEPLDLAHACGGKSDPSQLVFHEFVQECQLGGVLGIREKHRPTPSAGVDDAAGNLHIESENQSVDILLVSIAGYYFQYVLNILLYDDVLIDTFSTQIL